MSKIMSDTIQSANVNIDLINGFIISLTCLLSMSSHIYYVYRRHVWAPKIEHRIHKTIYYWWNDKRITQKRLNEAIEHQSILCDLSRKWYGKHMNEPSSPKIFRTTNILYGNLLYNWIKRECTSAHARPLRSFDFPALCCWQHPSKYLLQNNRNSASISNGHQKSICEILVDVWAHKRKCTACHGGHNKSLAYTSIMDFLLQRIGWMVC